MQDFNVPIREQPHRLTVFQTTKGSKQPGWPFKDRRRGINTGLSQSQALQRIAHDKAGVEIHFISAVMGPFIEAGAAIRRQCQRGNRCVLIKPQQDGTGHHRRQRSHETGRAEQARHFRCHEHPANAATGFIADHGGADQALTVKLAGFGQCQQGRPDHHAEMRDTACMHVLTHQPVPADSIGKGGIIHRRQFAVADNDRAVLKR